MEILSFCPTFIFSPVSFSWRRRTIFFGMRNEIKRYKHSWRNGTLTGCKKKKREKEVNENFRFVLLVGYLLVGGALRRMGGRGLNCI